MSRPFHGHPPKEHRVPESEWQPPKGGGFQNGHPNQNFRERSGDEVRVIQLGDRLNGRNQYQRSRLPEDPKDAEIERLRYEVKMWKNKLSRCEAECRRLGDKTREQEARLTMNAREQLAKDKASKSGDKADVVPSAERKVSGASPKQHEHSSVPDSAPYIKPLGASNPEDRQRYDQGSKPPYDAHMDKHGYYRPPNDSYPHREPYYERRSEHSQHTSYRSQPESYQHPSQPEYYSHPRGYGHQYEPPYWQRACDRYDRNNYEYPSGGYAYPHQQNEMYASNRQGYPDAGPEPRRYDYGQHHNVPNPNQRGSSNVPVYPQNHPQGHEHIDRRAHQPQFEDKAAPHREVERHSRPPPQNDSWDDRRASAEGAMRQIPRDQRGHSMPEHRPRDAREHPIPNNQPVEQRKQSAPNMHQRGRDIPREDESHLHRPASGQHRQYEQNPYNNFRPDPSQRQQQQGVSTESPSRNAKRPADEPSSNIGGSSMKRQDASSKEGSVIPKSWQPQQQPPSHVRQDVVKANNPYANQDRQNSNKPPQPNGRQQDQHIHSKQPVSTPSRLSKNIGAPKSSNPPSAKVGGSLPSNSKNLLSKSSSPNKFGSKPNIEKQSTSCPNSGSFPKRVKPQQAKSASPNPYSAKSAPQRQSPEGSMAERKIVKGLVMGPHDPSQETVREEMKIPAKNKRRRNMRGRGGHRARGHWRGGRQ